MKENANEIINNKPLISVIVPVYNVEKYIERCLDSIINQTYNNLEIILVDDGTQDHSGDICDEYAKRDNRITVIHKANGGLSDARNCGIEHSTGEYLTFIDSDDYIDCDYVEFLFNLVKKGYKLALCSLHVVYPKKSKACDLGSGKEIVVSGKECIEMLCYSEEVDTSAYAKLIHRSLFNSVRFPKGRIFEDHGTSYLLFDQCDKIICGFVPKYYYVIRDNSIVTSPFSLKKLDLIDMTNQMADYVSNKYPDLKDATLRRQGYAYFSTLNQMLNVDEPEYIEKRKEIIKFLKSNKSSVIKNHRTPKRDKLAYYCLSLGFPFYKFCWKLYRKFQRG
jgi:glycosyltransferase involved in cell wall biosynthesis